MSSRRGPQGQAPPSRAVSILPPEGPKPSLTVALAPSSSLCFLLKTELGQRRRLHMDLRGVAARAELHGT